MTVAVRRVDAAEGGAGIRRAIHARIQDVDLVGILRIGKNVREVPGALREAVILIQLAPGRARIVRTEQAAVFRLDQRVHALAAGSSSNTDSPKDVARQSMAGQLLPSRAAVDRF